MSSPDAVEQVEDHEQSEEATEAVRERADSGEEEAQTGDAQDEEEKDNSGQHDDADEERGAEEETANGNEEKSEHDGDEKELEEKPAKKTVDDSDDEEFAGFGDEEVSPNKSSSSAKKRAILSSDDEEDDDDKAAEDEEGEGEEEKEGEEEEESGGEAEDGEEVEGINKKKKKKHHKRDHHKHHHKSHHKKHHHKKHRGEGEEEGATAEDGDEEELEKKPDGEEEAEAGNEDDEEIQSAQHRETRESDKSSDEEEDTAPKKQRKEVSDLEIVLNKQKEENRKKRRKKVDSEELNDMDNLISNFISEMKNVASDDRAANERSQTAVQKLKMLPDVINLLQKSDYHATMIELGILGAIAEWLAPLPDRSLPNIKIREAFIDALKDFGEINADYLKSSGIGKAVMFLYKHSKETKPNKLKLEKLIHNWSRPIFNLDANFKQMSKEERMNRDIEHIKSGRRNSNDGNQSQSVDDLLNASDRMKSSRKGRQSNDESDSESDQPYNKLLRPGDPGFCPRARVPMPSVKDYVIRPKSTLESIEMAEKKVKKTVSRLDKHKRHIAEMKRVSKFQRAVNMSVSGKF